MERWKHFGCLLAASLLLCVAGCVPPGYAGQKSASIGMATTGKPIDGVHCDSLEGTAYHIHVHLTLERRGRSVTIPAGVGYGPGDCLYWLHTHDVDGVIHVEAPAHMRPTLGAFFDVWGEPLSRTRAFSLITHPGARLKIYLDRRPYYGNPRDIVLRDHEEIAIELGPPFASIPHFDFHPYD